MTFDKLNAALCGANAISALCLISPIFAQSAPVQLPEVSVSASRIEQPVAQTASSVSIITAKEIEAQQRRSFSD
jgi:vitamin B12 transporter